MACPFFLPVRRLGSSGWNPAPANVLTFVEQRHPGVAYQQIFLADQVYVFRRS